MTERADIAVLGAGIVGVSTALHLLQRGRTVLLIDRREPGEETSYGNAGVVARDALVPVLFPQGVQALWPFALNRTVAAHYHLRDLLGFAPWLAALRRNSAPAVVERYATIADRLAREVVRAHHALAGPAGAEHLFRQTGWLRIFRTPEGFAGAEKRLLAKARAAGVAFEVLDTAATLAIEPHLEPAFHRAILFPETESVASPGRVTQAYAEHFIANGGRFLKREIAEIRPLAKGFEIGVGGETVHADQVVVCLGIWSKAALKPLGYDLPLAPKRGYHRHYAPAGEASLSRPVVDIENGCLVTPMLDGIRLTTGVEFARHDSRPTPVQIARSEAAMRELFPLGAPVEATPWMGSRPCFPDSLAAIGPAPNHQGLWFNFGHGHEGFSQGPAAGHLLADLVTWSRPLVDPEPYSPARFS
ncbi:NAD(P)/FAD-dependent oxidoreductase [Amorphus coralli]|uniref:NAD(P)/FAD-dependent oxidoreductase n=1 Tax=Amorphus coralli TaxID=340680 RepID=UPI00035FE369|nr:FAD-dependent oxidoreductase [Amorphus coralli]